MEESKTQKEIKNQFNLINFSAVGKYKSVNRAIRRGHVSPVGLIYPKRPFNNRTTTKNSRPLNELKKRIYEQLKYRN